MSGGVGGVTEEDRIKSRISGLHDLPISSLLFLPLEFRHELVNLPASFCLAVEG